MKKLYALLMAGVMTVAMAVPVLAAPSRQAESPSSQSYSSTAAQEAAIGGSTIKAGVDNTDVVEIGAGVLADEIVKVTSNAQVLRDLGVSTSAKLKAMVDVSYSKEIPAGGVQISFDVSGIAKKGDLVIVLHRIDSADKKPWEVVGRAVMGDNLQITGTFTSFSPVAFMVVDASDAAAAAATGVKAPKTGEF